MASFETIQHSHPLLGTLHGRELSNGVVQFRGIPFARIPERFRQSILADELSLEEKDCTEYSFVCPQQAEEHGAFGGKLPDDVDYRHDELRCLTLTVSAPKRALLVSSENGNIPVMVYVHGGGFARGANVGGVNDSARIVALARDEGTPVIVVNIHYRLNWFGFLACQDLIDDAEKHAEPPCNFGLFDQRMGFRWVKKYISGFGGNAAQITAFGESAGSSSLTYHMCSDEPLFNRAILQSGFPSTISAGQSLSAKDAQYIKLLEFCGIDPNDPARLSKLRYDVAAEKLIDAITALNPFAFTPLDHKTFFPEMPNLANEGKILAKCDWVDSVIIGDAFYEGFIFTHALKLVPCQLFVAYMHENFGDDTAIQVLEAYGIQPKMDDNLFWNRLTYLVGDAMFSMPCHLIADTIARESSKKVFRHNVMLRNPFLGSPLYQVQGHHFVELAYVFMTFLERFPTELDCETSREFARRWIAFSYQKEPWGEYGDRGSIAIVDSHSGWRCVSAIEDVAASGELEKGRRYKQWEILCQALSKAHDSGTSTFHCLDINNVMGMIHR